MYQILVLDVIHGFLAKSHRVPYPLSTNKSHVPFVVIHLDVWGPSPISTMSKTRWFVTFIDGCTCMKWFYLLKHKDEVLYMFKSVHTMVYT